MHFDNRGLFGARKLWVMLRRLYPDELIVRCTVERRMCALGLAGVPNAWLTTTCHGSLRPPRVLVTSSSGVSPQTLPILAGWPISPLCRHGVASSMSRSSWICVLG